jgi:hypothetical protein
MRVPVPTTWPPPAAHGPPFIARQWRWRARAPRPRAQARALPTPPPPPCSLLHRYARCRRCTVAAVPAEIVVFLQRVLAVAAAVDGVAVGGEALALATRTLTAAATVAAARAVHAALVCLPVLGRAAASSGEAAEGDAGDLLTLLRNFGATPAPVLRTLLGAGETHTARTLAQAAGVAYARVLRVRAPPRAHVHSACS